MKIGATVASILQSAKQIALVVHQQPDGDALGSAVALERALPGKTTIVCATPPSPIFRRILPRFTCQSQLPSNPDVIVILDCSELHRTGFRKQITSLAQKIPVVIIDHHPSGDGHKITNLCYQRRASATAELIAELLDELRIVIDAEIATALLLGLYTDTGGFQHSNTSAKALQLASRLVRYGGDIFTISSQLHRSQSVNQARLWGEILAGVEINRYGLATARVSQALLTRTKAAASDVLGLVNVLALANEVTAALVLVEDGSGWHGSLRTRHDHIDVGELARRLGGRGHRKAAGFLATFG